MMILFYYLCFHLFLFSRGRSSCLNAPDGNYSISQHFWNLVTPPPLACFTKSQWKLEFPCTECLPSNVECNITTHRIIFFYWNEGVFFLSWTLNINIFLYIVLYLNRKKKITIWNRKKRKHRKTFSTIALHVEYVNKIIYFFLDFSYICIYWIIQATGLSDMCNLSLHDKRHPMH